MYLWSVWMTWIWIWIWGGPNPNLLFGWVKRNGFGFAQIYLRFQGSKSMDLKSPHKPKNLEIPHPTLKLVLSSQFFFGYSVTLSLPCPSFSSFSFSQQGLSLSTLFFLFILSVSLFLPNLNHKGFGVFFGFHFFFFFVGLFGFPLICVWVLFGIRLIRLWVLFHSIFNDLFWVCLYFLFLFSFVGL